MLSESNRWFISFHTALQFCSAVLLKQKQKQKYMKNYECTNYSKLWTAKELTTLRELKESGSYSAHTISKTLNRSLGSVRGQLYIQRKHGNIK